MCLELNLKNLKRLMILLFSHELAGEDHATSSYFLKVHIIFFNPLTSAIFLGPPDNSNCNCVRVLIADVD